MPTLPAVLLLAGCIAATAAASPDATAPDATTSVAATEETEMPTPPPPSFSRPPPAEVAPIEADGVRYERLMATDDPGARPGGLLRATRIGTGEVLWTSRVYDTEVDPSLERDVQQVYIEKMRLNGDTIVVTTEAGDTFHVDRGTGRSSRAD